MRITQTSIGEQEGDFEQMRKLLAVFLIEDAVLESDFVSTVSDPESHTLLIGARDEADDDRLIGMITVNILFEPTQKRGFLSKFSVLPEYRGQGIGKKLLAEAIEAARTRGAVEIALVSDPNDPVRQSALHIYESMGFYQKYPGYFILAL